MHQSGFSPKARWDMHIPEDSDSAGEEFLNQRIDCLVLFKSGKIYPQRFTCHNKEYEIKTINYNWQERRGQEVINFFSVSTGTDAYQISFNNTSFGWRLDKVL
ncbi:MAG: hypothetical protein NT060_00865 [Candidatus Omnitrophica bacterium]|nr:hypothetical protein [Candidatus Omnitrophota bacterium]